MNTDQQFKPPSYPGQRSGMGMHGQGGPGPGMQGVHPGYGAYGMNDMPPHPQRGIMDGSVHPQHMGPVGGVGHGGYRPISNEHMGHGNMGNMHDMMGAHYSRDMLKKEDQHHYSNRM
jgi:hypothetical protein